MTDAELGVRDWRPVADAVIKRGFRRIEGAIGSNLALELMSAAPEPWYPLRPDEGDGSVRHAGFGTFVPLAGAEPIARRVGAWITDSLMAVLPPGTPPLPGFNEVSWTRYPAGAGHITAHRDPPGCGGVIAIANLSGSAIFYVGRRGQPDTQEWNTAPGDLVILRGNAWPDRESVCVLHGLEPPRVGERTIMTLRHNRGGAGANYFQS